ncbi:hypothetical protein Scep_019248 [Stephania cephalantha]|uniref:Uncharacterized protein n=1 Tax=Stephania cephalantha TaxID=152367 RepID=A0AAP0NMP9_9MAGN
MFVWQCIQWCIYWKVVVLGHTGLRFCLQSRASMAETEGKLLGTRGSRLDRPV